MTMQKTPRPESGGHATAGEAVPATVPQTSDAYRAAQLRVQVALLVAIVTARTAVLILEQTHRRAARR